MRSTDAHRGDADALVFFGATGDLAYKKIFPALQVMIREGQLTAASTSRRTRR
jgi:glucose-6-phosphate 1-dehydrogenase